MEKLFIQTCKGKKTSKIPKWFMRQAGRYLPEYMEIRNNSKNFLDLCYSPKKAAEVTLQPLRRFNFDAAIIFSDILVIPDALGVKVEFVKGEGPKLQNLMSDIKISDLSFNISYLDPVYEAINLTRSNLDKEFNNQKALIGFAGAPWTIATYMIFGSGVKDYNGIKKWVYENNQDFNTLLDILVESITEHLIKQIESGVEVVQIFDSWASALNPTEFRNWCIDPIQAIVRKVKKAHPEIPIIGFPKGAGVMYRDFVDNVKIDVLSVDQNLPIDWAVENIDKTIQGNLDPLLLATDVELAKERTYNILQSCKGKAHIFNLGHGILPFTPVENVAKVIEVIDEFES